MDELGAPTRVDQQSHQQVLAGLVLLGLLTQLAPGEGGAGDLKLKFRKTDLRLSLTRTPYKGLAAHLHWGPVRKHLVRILVPGRSRVGLCASSHAIWAHRRSPATKFQGS